MQTIKRMYVIVGAGPVGLWTAIQLKSRMPDCQVLLYERHAQYQREHVLKLQHSSLLFGAHLHVGEAGHDFFTRVFGKSRLQMHATRLSRSFVSTKTIEFELRNWALRLGCEIRHQEVLSLSSLKEHCPDATAFVLANGAHSALRRELLGEDDVEQNLLQSIIEWKFVCQPSSWPKKDRAPLSALQHVAFEYCGKPEAHGQPVSVRFFVSEDVYENTPPATFKAPLRSLEGLPPALADDLSHYASLRGFDVDTLLSHGGLSKLQLSVYKARNFAAMYMGTPVFLVGDAAMGVPYFRALNCGLVLGSRLAWVLHRKNSATDAVMIYDRYRPVHAGVEFALANGKNSLLNTYHVLRKLYKRMRSVSLSN